jgi:hypothetical protein
MTHFTDGPAEGQTLMLRRAPFFLRAVQSADGEWDALDHIDDTAAPCERVVVYQMEGEPTWCHIRMSGKRHGGSGVYRGGAYKLAADPPPDDVARDNARWREWCAVEGQKRGFTP